MGGNLAARPDRAALLDFDERTDPRLRTDDAAIEVDEVAVQDDRAFGDLAGCYWHSGSPRVLSSRSSALGKLCVSCRRCEPPKSADRVGAASYSEGIVDLAAPRRAHSEPTNRTEDEPMQRTAKPKKTGRAAWRAEP